MALTQTDSVRREYVPVDTSSIDDVSDDRPLPVPASGDPGRHRRLHGLCAGMAVLFPGLLVASSMLAPALALLPVAAAQAAARDDELERCRYLHGRIAHYTRLRRAGGSSSQMERWRYRRSTYEAEYRERRCHRFGRRLTLDR